MATSKEHTKSKSKPEAVMVYPGKRPVKNIAAAKGGNPRPADPMTGGGKVKSAAGQSEPVMESAPMGKNPSKRNAGEPSSRERSARAEMDAESMRGSAIPSKEGMAKSSQRKEPKIDTATHAPASRAKPVAQPARGSGRSADAPARSAKSAK